MFVGMGVSAVFPVLDGLATFGWQDMENQIGLSWLVLQGALYIVGAGLYAVSLSLSFAHLDADRGRLESRKPGIRESSTLWEAPIKSFMSSSYWRRCLISEDLSKHSIIVMGSWDQSACEPSLSQS